MLRVQPPAFQTAAGIHRLRGFRLQGQLYLLGYTRDEEVRLIYLEALGPHENFYRDLKS